MDRGMLIDIDHMSAKATDQALDLLESRNYPGVISSHSWSTPDTYPRIYDAGGNSLGTGSIVAGQSNTVNVNIAANGSTIPSAGSRRPFTVPA